MKMREIKDLPKADLELKLRDLQEEYANFRFQHATHQLDNTARLRTIGRDIARLRTVLREMQLGRRPAREKQQV
jgi:large subunit ribosomal protein L29